MNQLKNTWNLLDEINDLNINKDLQAEINIFIANFNIKHKNMRPQMCFSHIIYRCNLHYIIDNIKNPSLLSELKKHNNYKPINV